MKILLTGKHGQLGRALELALARLGQVCAVGRGDCDFHDEAAVRQLVRRLRPDVIVNAAAYTQVDRAEFDPQAAHAVNARAVAVLAQEAARLGALLVHFSTDYVFNGEQSAPYRETDAPHPLNVYGQSKLAGDRAVQAHCRRHLILRTGWVCGVHGSNFIKTMLDLGGARDQLGVVADQFGAPTPAAWLAAVTAQLLARTGQHEAGDLYGLYHVAAAGVTNWHHYACHLIERARASGHPLRVGPDAIIALSSAQYPMAARRPRHAQLNTDKLWLKFGLRLAPWEDGVNQVVDQLVGASRASA